MLVAFVTNIRYELTCFPLVCSDASNICYQWIIIHWISIFKNLCRQLAKVKNEFWRSGVCARPLQPRQLSHAQPSLPESESAENPLGLEGQQCDHPALQRQTKERRRSCRSGRSLPLCSAPPDLQQRPWHSRGGALLGSNRGTSTTMEGGGRLSVLGKSYYGCLAAGESQPSIN